MGQYIWKLCMSLCPKHEPQEELVYSFASEPLLESQIDLDEEDPVPVSPVQSLQTHTQQMQYQPVGKFDKPDPPPSDYRKALQRYIARIISFGEQGDIPVHSGENIHKNKTVMAEVKLMSRLLPCQYTNAIFVAINEKDMSVMEALVIGTEGTPYEHGVFLFKIELSEDYPNSPPHVQLLTTGGGRIRFNPNLYESGYVCLSLLGTWRGEEKENWQPHKSNIAQVLMSIQTLVMNEDVFYNQPSYEDSNRTEAEPYNRAYQNIVKFGNITYAMNQAIENPPVRFRQIILTHFYLKRNRIIESIQKWIMESKQTTIFYDHSQSHNYQLALRYSENDFNYKNDLIMELKKLHKNLSAIKIEDTLLGNNLREKE